MFTSGNSAGPTPEQFVAQPSAVLSEIFTKISMGELPAMSQHAQELRVMTDSAGASNAELVKVILKDYALTSRILQTANSAYYAQGRDCNTISKAVSNLGSNVVRESIAGIALFEDFVRAGIDKEAIQGIITRSFLAGIFARRVVIEKNRKLELEEVFLCALFHHLGKVVICLYQPVMYREIESTIETGCPEDMACREVLGGLTYKEIGIEVARFWNLPDSFVRCMEGNDSAETANGNGNGYPVALTRFVNDFVDMLCDGSDLGFLFNQYGPVLGLRVDDALNLMSQSVAEGETMSIALRSGVAKLKLAVRLRNFEINIRRGFFNSDNPADQVALEGPALAKGDDVGSFLTSLREEEKAPPKSIKEFIRDLIDLTESNFALNAFHALLMEAFHRGLGFDRAILATVNTLTVKETLVGRYGAGELGPEEIKRFECVLDPTSQCPLASAMNCCKDMMISADKAFSFPAELQHLVKDRTVYLFPICIDGKGVSMIYLDRKASRPVIDKDMLKTVRQLRDLAVSAIIKIRSGF